MVAAIVVSVRTGQPRTMERPAWDHARGGTWTSAYVKEEVGAPVRVTTLGLEGDVQVDTRGHGGPHKAVLAYPAAHYPRWREELGLPLMGPGGFGENLAVEGLDETQVCVGDVFALGGARLQVSQPRGPCANISRRWDREDLLRRVEETGRAGWYLRVLREGVIERGQEMKRLEQPHPGWTVARVLRLHTTPALEPDAVRWLAKCEALTPKWRDRFARQARKL